MLNEKKNIVYNEKHLENAKTSKQIYTVYENGMNHGVRHGTNA